MRAMRAMTWVLALGLVACSAPPAKPSVAPTELPVHSAEPTQGQPSASAASGAPSAITSIAPSASAASVAAPPAPLATVVPRAEARPITDTYDDRANEGWPELVYTGFPAVSADGAKVLLVEERDGSGHVAAFGVRVIDAPTSKSSEWFPFGTTAKPPRTRPSLVASVATINARASAMHGKLAKTEWRALEGAEAPPDEAGVWHVRGLSIAVTWTKDDVPQPKRLVIADERTKAKLGEHDLGAWSRKGVRCAMNDLVLRGVSDALLVFSQGVGPTLHDCDGVIVPTAYRVVSFERQ